MTLRLSFAVLVVASFVLGFTGFAAFLGPGSSVFDLVYYSLQLFVLDPAPFDVDHEPLGWALEVARFTAPAATIYALVAGLLLLFSTEIRRLRARRSRGHAVICGTGPIAGVLTQRLRTAGRGVVQIAAAPSADMGVLHVVGDPRDAAVLRAAGIERAAVLYACEADSATNTAIALAAHALPRPRARPLAAYGLISDPDMCAALRARRLGLTRPTGLHLDFFNPDALAARVLLKNDPLDEPAPVMIIGLGAFGRTLLLELARQWRLRAPTAGPLPVTVVDADATSAVATLSTRHDLLLKACELTTADLEPEQVSLPDALRGGPWRRVYVCYPDQDLALKTALTSLRLWGGGPGSLVVRVDHAAAFDAGLLEGLDGALRVFPVTDAAADPGLIAEDLVETLAMAAHTHYLADQASRGGRRSLNASLVPWEELEEDKKESNRLLAEDIGRKLKEVGCALGPRVDPDLGFAFTGEEIEILAEMEHVRWVRMMLARGWTNGPLRDDARRTHPDIGDWATLSATAKEKDRDTVRNLPDILAIAGFQVVRTR
ncbi:RyR domain-containing protein [Nonomuraea africana]|uniref:Voltage-gated potassium channel Kch n=1 Tax=Nonomuraea africana TaxID=46171 RepID=A0ABR9K919_9ACTN|nr:RyR domain-containing protein [Nonomuraea africana]MBE1558496.1 voltage-gated potassium channel Kch [Nonomuraea africana]